MSSDSEDELFSRNLDPLKMLYSKDFGKNLEPGKDYCLFDNMASFVGSYKAAGENLGTKLERMVRQPLLKNVKALAIQEGESFTRRFLPHQQMIRTEQKKKIRQPRTALTDMEKEEGPLKQLRLWVEEKARVKVLIRKNHGIRGFVTGVIRLFDKHWNLVLTDVEELYKRRKFKCAKELCIDSVTELQAVKRFMELGLPPPAKHFVKSIDKKRVEILKAHSLLLVKGDQVAVVMKYVEGDVSY